MQQTEKDYKGLNFYEYMQKRYEGESSPLGELAEELARLYDHGLFVEEIASLSELEYFTKYMYSAKAIDAIRPGLWKEYQQATAA